MKKNLVEEHSIAQQLYEYAFFAGPQGIGPDSEEQARWAAFLRELKARLFESGCNGNVEDFFKNRPYEKACGYHKEYGYFYVSFGDKGTYDLTISEPDEEKAGNLFLERLIDRCAYEKALEMREKEELNWSYHCSFDYRKLWFGLALDWLAPVVDWAFFSECEKRYIALLNKWFVQPHWEYDYQLCRIIEVSESNLIIASIEKTGS